MHIDWYTWNKMDHVAGSELFETYFARKPAHLLRIAMCLHLGTHWDLEVCAECWNRSKEILEWIEGHFELLSGKMFKTPYGEDQDLVVRMLERNGYEMTWTKLLRAMGYKMGASQLRMLVYNLKEQGIAEELHTAIGHTIRLRRAV